MSNVPAGAMRLLAFIARAETGRSGDAAYRTIIGHREDSLPEPITSMTVDALLKAQVGWGRKWGSSAAGAYQIIRKTLAGLKDALSLTGEELFAPALQDRLGFELLRRRGWDKAVAGKLSPDAFAAALSKEWASLPVLRDTRGAHRRVKRGESYYAGDGLNSALVSPESFERSLHTALGLLPSPDATDGATAASWPEKGVRDNAIVRDLQERLRALGYVEVGNADGDFGDLTEKAILIFRHDAGLPLLPVIDNSLMVALAKAQPRVLAPEREEATPKDVREKVPEARASWWSKIMAMAGALVSIVIGALGWIVDNLAGAKALVKPVLDTFGSVPWWAYALILALGLGLVSWKSRQSEQGQVAAYQTGERR